VAFRIPLGSPGLPAISLEHSDSVPRVQDPLVRLLWQAPERGGSLDSVSDTKNLADPAFEPTDEDLIGLAKRAFAHIREAQEDSLRKVRADIAIARQAALERLHRRKAEAAR
jgi:hypothetical protein